MSTTEEKINFLMMNFRKQEKNDAGPADNTKENKTDGEIIDLEDKVAKKPAVDKVKSIPKLAKPPMLNLPPKLATTKAGMV